MLEIDDMSGEFGQFINVLTPVRLNLIPALRTCTRLMMRSASPRRRLEKKSWFLVADQTELDRESSLTTVVYMHLLH